RIGETGRCDWFGGEVDQGPHGDLYQLRRRHGRIQLSTSRASAPSPQRSVDELELSVRSYNCLKNAGIKTIRDLVQRSEREMLATKNFGKKSLGEIRDILNRMGLDFGMEFDEQGNPIPGTGG